MASATASQLLNSQTLCSYKQPFSAQPLTKSLAFAATYSNDSSKHCKCLLVSSNRNSAVLVKSASGKDRVVSAIDDEGVSLGTMTLPINIDIPRFETLLFQWANSLCQGAQLPLPVPLKVDKIEGGVRLGFVDIDDGKTDVRVYINCLVIPGSNDSDPPRFRATRNGALKDKVPPGEPRIMKSLLAALQKSVEFARA